MIIPLGFEELRRHDDDPEDPLYGEIQFSPDNMELILGKLNEVIAVINILTE